MVIGESEKMPAALVQISPEFVRDWAERKGIPIGETLEEISKNELLIKRVEKDINHFNERFGKWEKIKRFEITPDVWTIKGGHLTPTMKMKRKVIKEKYLDLYNKIYDH